MSLNQNKQRLPFLLSHEQISFIMHYRKSGSLRNRVEGSCVRIHAQDTSTENYSLQLVCSIFQI